MCADSAEPKLLFADAISTKISWAVPFVIMLILISSGIILPENAKNNRDTRNIAPIGN